jgi:hypothetical protein
MLPVRLKQLMGVVLLVIGVWGEQRAEYSCNNKRYQYNQPEDSQLPPEKYRCDTAQLADVRLDICACF